MSSGKTNNLKGRATIRDVAQAAEVSVGTVSHVLNKSKGASEATRTAVMKAVVELDYRPNSLAKSLIARRTRPALKQTSHAPTIISVGYLSVDYMVSIDHVPVNGERMTSKAIHKMLGGPAANVAVFAAGLGVPFELNVEIISQVGGDADSQWALEELAHNGVDVSGTLQEAGGRLSRCIVLVDANGQRTIVNEPLQVPVNLLEQHLSQQVQNDNPACIHFDGFHFETAQKVKSGMRAAGYLSSLHAAGLDAKQKTLEGCLELMCTFDLLFLDQDTFAKITRGDLELEVNPERLFSRDKRHLCRAIVLTKGIHGATLLRPDTAPLNQSCPATQAVDVTGAGDAFTGLFLAAWLSCGDMEAALRHAVNGASLSVTALGAQGRIVRAEDIISKDHIHDE
ncbi:PfkB family carbohydrate kinase [Maritalea sp.]|uniref:carbohydrate kinase family protein n=1 Tax=Maritalea sp. TaxID=2003361 RepID=UPI003EF5EA42